MGAHKFPPQKRDYSTMGSQRSGSESSNGDSQSKIPSQLQARTRNPSRAQPCSLKEPQGLSIAYHHIPGGEPKSARSQQISASEETNADKRKGGQKEDIPGHLQKTRPQANGEQRSLDGKCSEQSNVTRKTDILTRKRIRSPLLAHHNSESSKPAGPTAEETIQFSDEIRPHKFRKTSPNGKKDIPRLTKHSICRTMKEIKPSSLPKPETDEIVLGKCFFPTGLRSIPRPPSPAQGRYRGQSFPVDIPSLTNALPSSSDKEKQEMVRGRVDSLPRPSSSRSETPKENYIPDFRFNKHSEQSPEEKEKSSFLARKPSHTMKSPSSAKIFASSGANKEHCSDRSRLPSGIQPTTSCSEIRNGNFIPTGLRSVPLPPIHSITSDTSQKPSTTNLSVSPRPSSSQQKPVRSFYTTGLRSVPRSLSLQHEKQNKRLIPTGFRSIHPPSSPSLCKQNESANSFQRNTKQIYSSLQVESTFKSNTFSKTKENRSIAEKGMKKTKAQQSPFIRYPPLQGMITKPNRAKRTLLPSETNETNTPKKKSKLDFQNPLAVESGAMHSLSKFEKQKTQDNSKQCTTKNDKCHSEKNNQIGQLPFQTKNKKQGNLQLRRFLDPLSEEEETQVLKIYRQKDQKEIKYIPSARIVLRGEDFKRLRGVRWLNDEVINAYMSLINERNDSIFAELTCTERSDIPHTYVFNTFFYTRLTSGPERYDFTGVRKWTMSGKIDVTKKDLLLFPVNLGNHHWVLAGIDRPRRSFFYLDSMAGPDKGGVLETLRRWYHDELEDKFGKHVTDEMDLGNWSFARNRYMIRRVGVLPTSLESGVHSPRLARIPVQTDGGSCGVFIAKMADCLSLGIKIYFNQRDIPLVRRRMVLDLLRGQLMI